MMLADDPPPDQIAEQKVAVLGEVDPVRSHQPLGPRAYNGAVQIEHLDPGPCHHRVRDRVVGIDVGLVPL